MATLVGGLSLLGIMPYDGMSCSMELVNSTVIAVVVKSLAQVLLLPQTIIVLTLGPLNCVGPSQSRSYRVNAYNDKYGVIFTRNPRPAPPRPARVAMPPL